MPASQQEIVADEARRRTQVAVAAIIGGIAFVVSGILRVGLVSDQPRVQLVDALDERLSGARPVLKAREALYFDDKGVELILIGLFVAISAIGSGIVLSYLFRAARSRDPQTKRVGIVGTVIGTVVVSLGALVAAVVQFGEASSFADRAQQTADAARDVTEGTPYLIATSMYTFFGAFALALGFIFVTYNAMRVGLLTRFMGVLGMIAGVLVLLPFLAGGLPIVQGLWLVGLGLLMLGVAPNALPPAWEAGRAMPWPTQQEIREARDQSKAEQGESSGRRLRFPSRPAPPPEPAEPPDPPTVTAPAGPAHSSSKKRKRKRRS